MTTQKTFTLKSRKNVNTVLYLPVHFYLPYIHKTKSADFGNMDILSLVMFIFFCEINVYYYKALESCKECIYCVFVGQICLSVTEIQLEETSSKSAYYPGFIAF